MQGTESCDNSVGVARLTWFVCAYQEMSGMWRLTSVSSAAWLLGLIVYVAWCFVAVLDSHMDLITDICDCNKLV